jgi:hypothetical protein
MGKGLIELALAMANDSDRSDDERSYQSKVDQHAPHPLPHRRYLQVSVA